MNSLEWVNLPAQGAYAGLMILGATGAGKTSFGMYPMAQQLFTWKGDKPGERIGGLVLEVKGSFCHHVRDILVRAGRAEDYLEIGPKSTMSYNPLDSSLRPDELAYSIGSLIEQSTGRRTHDPFWREAYSNAIGTFIGLIRLLRGYITFRDIYRVLLSNELQAELLKEAEEKIVGRRIVCFTREAYLDGRDKTLKNYDVELDEDGPEGYPYVGPWSGDLEGYIERSVTRKLKSKHPLVPEKDFKVHSDSDETDPVRVAKFQSVKFAVEKGWWKLEEKLRSSIIESCRGALSIFDEPEVGETFCPPQSHPNRLSNFVELIEQGKVVCVNFPIATNARLARFIGTMAKLDFERAVIERLERGEPTRPVAFVCDEYDKFASVGGNEPIGDDKAFGLSREAKLIPVVALHSFSSLQSTVGDHWRSIAQHFRSKVIMSLSDDFTAQVCENLCGKEWRWVQGYSLGESGQKASEDTVTDRVESREQGISVGTSYSYQLVPRVPATEFFELPNGAAIALIYDGRDYHLHKGLRLKPYFADRQMSFAEQRERLII